MDTLPISSEIKARIVEAANRLYEQSGSESFPSVDQVRREARVDMNAASAVMREWRRAQTAKAAPVAVQVPEALSQAHNQALVGLWSHAQELANESLRSAQAAWEEERGDMDDMRQELALAFESQAQELEAAQDRIAALEGEARQKELLAREVQRLQQALDAHQSLVKAHDQLKEEHQVLGKKVVELETRYQVAQENMDKQAASHAEEIQRLVSQHEKAFKAIEKMKKQ